MAVGYGAMSIVNDEKSDGCSETSAVTGEMHPVADEMSRDGDEISAGSDEMFIVCSEMLAVTSEALTVRSEMFVDNDAECIVRREAGGVCCEGPVSIVKSPLSALRG